MTLFHFDINYKGFGLIIIKLKGVLCIITLHVLDRALATILWLEVERFELIRSMIILLAFTAVLKEVEYRGIDISKKDSCDGDKTHFAFSLENLL